MSEFDKKQIAILKPLIDNDVVLHFSFYANTFPIAYHYNLLIEELIRQDPSKKSKYKELIISHDWSEVFPSKSNFQYYSIIKTFKPTGYNWEYPEKINLFYTADIKYNTEDFKAQNPFKKISDEILEYGEDEKITPARFSNYVPRFAFLNNNLYTQKFSHSLKEGEKFITIDDSRFKDIEQIRHQFYDLTKVLEQAESDGIEYICIYSETFNEAVDIFEGYNWPKDKIRYYDESNLQSLELSDEKKNGSKTLDIYYYGAPTSFLLHHRNNKFIPVLIDKANTDIETMAVVHYNKNKSDDIISAITSAIQEYHANLYTAAVSTSAIEDLNNVRLAYNKYAKLISHSSFFLTPESFVNCIALHHKYKPNEIPPPVSNVELGKDVVNPAQQKNIHLHYGAGKLGIGLVLPLVVPDKDCNHNQLLVIQKNRPEWIKKIKLDLKTISLENSQTEISLDLVKVSKEISDDFPDNNTFYLFDELKHINSLFEKVTSISYSLGDQGVEKEFLEFLAGLKQTGKKILVFPFENKPFGILPDSSKERDDIVAKNPDLEDVRLKADRICFDRRFDQGNRVKVTCEDHIECVFKIDEAKTNNLFDLSKNRKNQLIFTDDESRYKFYSLRKEYLVNELHFALAVNGYDFLLSKGIIHWENQFVTIIQSALASDPQYKIPVDTFIRLQITRLLHSSHNLRPVMKEVFGLNDVQSIELMYESLLRYAKGVTQRFNASREDQISRVFNASDEKAIERKYKTIIKEIEKFVTSNKSIIENTNILECGAFIEFQYVIQDLKSKIENVFRSRIDNFNEDLKVKSRDQTERILELESFESKIKSLTQKPENVLVVFDLDGTLFKAKEIFLPAIKTVLAENDITTISDDECMKYIGMPLIDFEKHMRSLVLKTSYKSFWERLEQLEFENINKAGELFEGVIDTLEALKKCKYTLAISTNARKAYLDAVIEKFELLKYFEMKHIRYPEYYPKPEGKSVMLGDLKNLVRPFKSYMIGDRFYDLVAAEEQNFTFVGANYGYAVDENELQRNVRVNNFSELRDIINCTL